jgi:hypothetical protein
MLVRDFPAFGGEWMHRSEPRPGLTTRFRGMAKKSMTTTTYEGNFLVVAGQEVAQCPRPIKAT